MMQKDEGTDGKVTLARGIALARLWGFSPSQAQADAMQRHLGEQRKAHQDENSLVTYEDLLHLLSAIPHTDDQSEELALLFKHFDVQVRLLKQRGLPGRGPSCAMAKSSVIHSSDYVPRSLTKLQYRLVL